MMSTTPTGPPLLLLPPSANSTSLDHRDSTTDDGKSADKIFTDLTYHVFEVMVYTCLCGAVSMGGIVANLTNLLVFFKQGILVDSVTASLTGLAVADLGSLITLLWLSINYAIMQSPPPDLPWDPMSVLYITGGWPHVMFNRVACWITAYVAFERCMCVLLPFKVKGLFTARRSVVIIVAIFIVLTSSYIPTFYTIRLQNVRDPITNVTKLGLVFTSNKLQIERICHYINNVIMPTLSLSIVILCTRLTVSGVNASTKWKKRKNATSGYVMQSTNNGEQIDVENVDDSMSNTQDSTTRNSHDTTKAPKVESKPSEVKTTISKNHQKAVKESAQPMESKEAKVVRMITLICTLFIICNSLSIVNIYLRFIEPKIANMGPYHNFFHIVYSMSFFLESFNSSVNIFVYYSMSSRYKQEFRKLFRLQNI